MKTESCPDCDVVHDWVASNGKCKKCHGTGYKGFSDGVMFDAFSPPENQICENCGGSGICQTCHGEGIVEPYRSSSNTDRKTNSEATYTKSNRPKSTKTTSTVKVICNNDSTIFMQV